MRTIGWKLRCLRQSKGYTVEAAAKMVGMTKSQLTLAESGRHSPTWETLEKLGRLYNVTPKQMFAGVDTWELRGNVVNTDST